MAAAVRTEYRRPVLGLIVVLFSPAFGTAADWPHVRGPNYDGHSLETELAATWPEAGPPVLWTRTLGEGYSGFVAAGGLVFTQHQTRTGLFLIALDADTGAERWAQRIGWPWQPGGSWPGPYATPTVSGGDVFAVTPLAELSCHTAVDGQLRWSVDLRKTFGTRGTEFGYAAVPLVLDGRVFMPVGGGRAAVVALDAQTGRTCWTTGDEPASYCGLIPVTIGGRVRVLAYLKNSVALYDPTTGEQLWRERLSGDYDEHAAWPVPTADGVILSAPFGVGSRAFRWTTAADRPTAKLQWVTNALSCDVCSAVRVGNALFGFDLRQLQASSHRPGRGHWTCLDVDTGRVKYHTDELGQAGVIAADGKLIALDESGTLHLVAADPDRFAPLARAKLITGNRMGWTPPCLTNRRLMIRNHQSAMCVFLGRPSDLEPNRTLGLAAPSVGFDWTRLVPVEPEFPNDAPTPLDVTRWFIVSVGLFMMALGVAAGMAWLTGSRVAWVFVPLALLLTAGGTTALGGWFGQFVLTWPTTVFLVYRLTLGVGLTVGGSRRSRAMARGLLGVFVGVCYCYFVLCRCVGLPLAWGYLVGLLPATPIVLVAVQADRRWVRWSAEVGSFAAYFWVGGLFPAVKELWTR